MPLRSIYLCPDSGAETCRPEGVSTGATPRPAESSSLILHPHADNFSSVLAKLYCPSPYSSRVVEYIYHFVNVGLETMIVLGYFPSVEDQKCHINSTEAFLYRLFNSYSVVIFFM